MLTTVRIPTMRPHRNNTGDAAEMTVEQAELERRLREQNRILAKDIVEDYAQHQNWGQADLDQVLMSLGLMESPKPLIKRTIR
jgi:hypothetical protein